MRINVDFAFINLVISNMLQKSAGDKLNDYSYYVNKMNDCQTK